MKKSLEIIWKFKYPILAIVILTAIAITTNRLEKQRAEITRLTEIVKSKEAETIDSLITRFYSRLISEKDVEIGQRKAEITMFKNRVVGLNKDIINLKRENKDLIGEYNSNQTIDNCESIVKNQIKIISKQDTTIEELGKESESYSRALYLTEQKLSMKDTIIVSKENLVIAKDIRIRQLIYEKVELQHKNKVQKFWRNVGFVASGAIVVYQGLRK